LPRTASTVLHVLPLAVVPVDAGGLW